MIYQSKNEQMNKPVVYIIIRTQHEKFCFICKKFRKLQKLNINFLDLKQHEKPKKYKKLTEKLD